ncbi:unnamed protein product [Brachionus calyciflorus]|uniref:Small ribosomal subunit protein mS31 n=1 Tax=Brachionus calyciflorus TaxID=104777 RepID=A0A813TYS3_9BILA|nr:unnamed protein product [Brachionus calyciflorus]
MSKENDAKKKKNPKEENRKLNQIKKFSFIQLTPEQNSKVIETKKNNQDLESTALKLARLIIDDKEAAIVKLARQILNNEIDHSKTTQTTIKPQIINEKLKNTSNEQIKTSDVQIKPIPDTTKLTFSAQPSSPSSPKKNKSKPKTIKKNSPSQEKSSKIKNLDAKNPDEQSDKIVKNNLVKEQESAAIKLAKLIDKEEPEKTADKLLKPIQQGSKIKNLKKKLKNNVESLESDKNENKNEKKLLDLEDLDSGKLEQKQEVSPVTRVDMYSKEHNLNSGKGLDLFKELGNLSIDKTKESPIWSMHYDEELKQAQEIPPMNESSDEDTDEEPDSDNGNKENVEHNVTASRIDESDADVPFHEHIFLDHHLEEFPQIEPIQLFMTLALNGLSQNGHLTLNEKKEIINWYKSYFDEKLDIIKEALDTEARIQETYIQSSK